MTKQQREINNAAFNFVQARKALRPIDNCPIESLEDNLSRERPYIISDLSKATSYSAQMRIWKAFKTAVYNLLP